ncbi:MAG: hypothetical protein HOO93_05465 [Methyloglobulus sp.]|nr:hypothetical protein [Methyloglobulus sp.]
MNFVAGTPSGSVDPAIVLSGVVGLAKAVVADIGPVPVVAAAFVSVGSELAAKNCLETHPEDNLLEVLQKQKDLQKTIIVETLPNLLVARRLLFEMIKRTAYDKKQH